MKKFLKGSVAAVFAACTLLSQAGTASAADALSATQIKFYQASDYVTLPYRLYLPPDYSQDKEYAFLLFLHGAGERGDGLDHIRNVGIINHILDNPETAGSFIIAAPQCASNFQWVDTPWSEGSYNQDDIPMSRYLTATHELIGELLDTYSIDEDRLYISGFSMGGYGTWDMITRYPDLFAAAVPICGAGDPSKAALIKDLPIWTFHSARDATVPASGSRDMVSALEAIDGNIRYTEYDSDAHNAWSPAYATEELYTWLFAQTKADKTALEACIGDAQELLEQADIGTQPGQYPPAAADALERAIAAAGTAFETEVTQTRLDEAQAALQAAVRTFEDVRIPAAATTTTTTTATTATTATSTTAATSAATTSAATTVAADTTTAATTAGRTDAPPAESSPDTGDDSRPAIWGALALLSAVLAVPGMKRVRYKKC